MKMVHVNKDSWSSEYFSEVMIIIQTKSHNALLKWVLVSNIRISLASPAPFTREEGAGLARLHTYMSM